MRSAFKTIVLAAAASVMLVGAAEAQIGRSSKNPEAGPAGAFRGGYGYRGYGYRGYGRGPYYGRRFYRPRPYYYRRGYGY